MDILFLLVPVSVLLALGVVALLAWSVWSGQFDDVEKEGQRILQDTPGDHAAVDSATLRPADADGQSQKKGAA
jgi:cbb3-type cytochrome oxidase maturation protein